MPLMSTILDSLSSGVIAIDCDEKIIVFNDAAARLMGVLKEHVVGARLLTVIPNAGLVNVLRTGLPELGVARLSVNAPCSLIVLRSSTMA
jgi:PAS domain-containing protein